MDDSRVGHLEEEKDSFDDSFTFNPAFTTEPEGVADADSFNDDDDMGISSDALLSDRTRSSSDKKSPTPESDAATLTSIMQALVTNKTFTSKDVSRALTICIRASDDVDTDPIARILCRGLGLLMANASADPKAISSVFYFLAKLAIKGHLHGCELPFAVVRQEVEGFMYSEMNWARLRCCQMIVSLLRVSAEEGDENEEENDEDEMECETMVNPTGGCIPSGLLIQWSAALSQRRLDKESSVRVAALQAIANLPMNKFFDHNGKLVESNKQLITSLRDESWEVREAAIRLISITNRADIDACFQFLMTEDNVAGRILMASKLISDVHLNSLSASQRIQFVKLLQEDTDQAVQSLLSSKLIPRWLNCLAEIDRKADVEAGIDEIEIDERLPAHPAALIQYINLFENEDLLVDLMRLALSYYMEAAVGSRTDGAAFLDFLQHLPVHQRERALLLHRKTVETEIAENGALLSARLFVHRCLIELMYSLHRSPSQLGQLEHAMNRLMPNMHKMAGILQSYCQSTVTKELTNQEEFCIRQMCYMIRCLDRGCSVGMSSWLNSLYFLAGSPLIAPPPSLVKFAVIEILENIVRVDQLEETSSWLCCGIGELLGGDGSDSQMDTTAHIPSQLSQSQVASLSSQQYSTLHRCAAMLHSLLSYAAITTFSPLMRNAFERMIDPLTVAPTISMRSLGCRLAGLASCLDDITLKQRVVILRNAIEIDVGAVKAVALTALTDVLCEKGFKLVARWCFPEIPENGNHSILLASVVEQHVYQSSAEFLPAVLADSLRMMYKSCTNWPNLLATILCRLFDRSLEKCDEGLEVLSVFLRGFVDRGMAGRLQLLSGFLSAIDLIDSQGYTKVSIGQMTSFVCRFLSNGTSGRSSKGNRRSGQQKAAGDAVDQESKPNSSVSVDLLLASGILRRIGTRPEDISAASLATSSLSGINIEEISTAHISHIRDVANAVAKKLSVDITQKKLIDGVKKFLRAVERSMKSRGCMPDKSPKVNPQLMNRLKVETDMEDELISQSLRTKCRLGVNSKNRGTRVKDEVEDDHSWGADTRVKVEEPDLDFGAKDEYQIEEDDDSDVIWDETPREPVAKRRCIRSKTTRKRRAVTASSKSVSTENEKDPVEPVVIEVDVSDDSQPPASSSGVITILDPMSSDRGDLDEMEQRAESPDIFSEP